LSANALPAQYRGGDITQASRTTAEK
jgi:hypothetical protein